MVKKKLNLNVKYVKRKANLKTVLITAKNVIMQSMKNVLKTQLHSIAMVNYSFTKLETDTKDLF